MHRLAAAVIYSTQVVLMLVKVMVKTHEDDLQMVRRVANRMYMLQVLTCAGLGKDTVRRAEMLQTTITWLKGLETIICWHRTRQIFVRDWYRRHTQLTCWCVQKTGSG